MWLKPEETYKLGFSAFCGRFSDIMTGKISFLVGIIAVGSRNYQFKAISLNIAFVEMPTVVSTAQNIVNTVPLDLEAVRSTYKGSSCFICHTMRSAISTFMSGLVTSPLGCNKRLCGCSLCSVV